MQIAAFSTIRGAEAGFGTPGICVCLSRLSQFDHNLIMKSSRSSTTYHEAKAASSAGYQAARSALKGPGGSFAGWIVSGRPWESFDLDGKVVTETTIVASSTILLVEQVIQNCV